MTNNAIFKSFCKLHDEIKQYAEKLNVDKGNVVSLSVLLYYIHLSISEEQGLFAATNRRESYIREFGIRKGLKKLVISSKIRIFIGENQ